jgi:hypothetical protein
LETAEDLERKFQARIDFLASIRNKDKKGAKNSESSALDLAIELDYEEKEEEVHLRYASLLDLLREYGYELEEQLIPVLSFIDERFIVNDGSEEYQKKLSEIRRELESYR